MSIKNHAHLIEILVLNRSEAEVAYIVMNHMCCSNRYACEAYTRSDFLFVHPDVGRREFLQSIVQRHKRVTDE